MPYPIPRNTREIIPDRLRVFTAESGRHKTWNRTDQRNESVSWEWKHRKRKYPKTHEKYRAAEGKQPEKNVRLGRTAESASTGTVPWFRAVQEAERYAKMTSEKMRMVIQKSMEKEQEGKSTVQENPAGSYLARIWAGVAAAAGQVLSAAALLLMPAGSILIVIGTVALTFVLILAIVLLVILGGIFGVSRGFGLSAKQDPACYLSAKYESHGDPGAIGGHGNLAFGEYQFHATAGTGLEDFIEWCFSARPGTYGVLEPFLYLVHGALAGNLDFQKIWTDLAENHKVQFEADQTIFTYNNYFLPAAEDLTERYGYDFVNAPDAVQACVVSFAIRDGGYGTGTPLYRYFSGVTEQSTAEEVITLAYDRMLERRGGNHEEAPRWQDEKQDCLDLLYGTLDIYEPDTSPSGYGQIDWSWKRTVSEASGNRAAQLALEKVGSRYSQALRDEEGYYDCSSLVYRVYREAGIEYLSGLSAAEEARYLEEHGMGIQENELQPGDLIFYSYGSNGRYKNISHVAIYVGNGQKVHAANRERGVVFDPYTPSNIDVYARPR